MCRCRIPCKARVKGEKFRLWPDLNKQDLPTSRFLLHQLHTGDGVHLGIATCSPNTQETRHDAPPPTEGPGGASRMQICDPRELTDDWRSFPTTGVFRPSRVPPGVFCLEMRWKRIGNNEAHVFQIVSDLPTVARFCPFWLVL